MKTVTYPAPPLPADEMATLKALCDGPIPTTRTEIGVINRLDAAGLIVQGDALDPDTAQLSRKRMVRHVAITEKGRKIVTAYRRLLSRSHNPF